MQKKGYSFFFFIFLFLSLLTFFLSKSNLLKLPQSYITKSFTTLSSPIFSLGDFIVQIPQNDTEKKLKEENLDLWKNLKDLQKLSDENKALHDQFQVAYPKSLDLLPSSVLSAPRFIPGFFSPEFLIIDVGEKDGVKIGDAVVLKDNLLGKVVQTTTFISQATLVSNPSLKFAAKTQNGALGVVKGEGNGDLFLDNVLLLENIGKGEKVLTVGDMKLDSTGFPPDLIVGEIISVEKNPSDLFQRAKLKTLVEFSKISKVFVVRGLR